MPEDYAKQHITELFAGIAGRVLGSLDNAKFLVIQSHPSGSMYDSQLVKTRREMLAAFAEHSDIPPYARQAIKGYLADPATVQQAVDALSDAEKTYREMFSNLGIKPKDERI